jgi:outer membrane lipoprotein SlyB
MQKVARVLTLLFVTSAISAAQSPATDWVSVKALSSGTEVRIAIAKSHAITGKLESVTNTSLTVNAQSIDRQQVTRVSVRSKARRKRSTLIGLSVGAAGGAIFGGVLAAACSDNLCGGHGGAIVGSSIAAGAIVGTLIGAAVSHGGWREIYRQ